MRTTIRKTDFELKTLCKPLARETGLGMSALCGRPSSSYFIGNVERLNLRHEIGPVTDCSWAGFALSRLLPAFESMHRMLGFLSKNSLQTPCQRDGAGAVRFVWAPQFLLFCK
jgi:hypothetical protein